MNCFVDGLFYLISRFVTARDELDIFQRIQEEPHQFNTPWNKIIYHRYLRDIPKRIALRYGFDYFYGRLEDDQVLQDFFRPDKKKPVRLLQGKVQSGKTNAICLYLLQTFLEGYLPCFFTARDKQLAQQAETDFEQFNQNFLKPVIYETAPNPEVAQCLYKMLRLVPIRIIHQKNFHPLNTCQLDKGCQIPLFLFDKRNNQQAGTLLQQCPYVKGVRPAFIVDEFHGMITDMDLVCHTQNIKFLHYLMRKYKSKDGIIIGISATQLRSYLHKVIGNSIKACREVTADCLFYQNKGLVYRGQDLELDANLVQYQTYDFCEGRTGRGTYHSEMSQSVVRLVSDIIQDPWQSSYQKMILINIFTRNEDQEQLAQDIIQSGLRIQILISNKNSLNSIGHLIDQCDDQIPLVIISGHKCKEGNRFKPTSHVRGKLAGITHYIYYPPPKAHSEGVLQHQRWMGQYPRDFPATQIYSTERGIKLIHDAIKIMDVFNKQYDPEKGRKSVRFVNLPEKIDRLKLCPRDPTKVKSGGSYQIFQTRSDLEQYVHRYNLDVREHPSSLLKIPTNIFRDLHLNDLENIGEINGRRSRAEEIKACLRNYLRRQLGFERTDYLQLTWSDKIRYSGLLKAVLYPRLETETDHWAVQFLAPKNLDLRQPYLKLMHYKNCLEPKKPDDPTPCYFQTPEGTFYLEGEGISFCLDEEATQEQLEEAEQENDQIFKQLDEIFIQLNCKNSSSRAPNSFQKIQQFLARGNETQQRQIGPIQITHSMIRQFLRYSTSKNKNQIELLVQANSSFKDLFQFKNYFKVHAKTRASLLGYVLKENPNLAKQILG